MTEMRDGKRLGLSDLSGGGGGFFIRRVASPGALAVRGAGKPQARRFISPSSNKENLPPFWAVRGTPPKRRSPLPEWYPRTPLRDITAIAKAIQRSRLRIAAAQQQSQRSEQSPQSVNPTTPATPAQAKQDVPHNTEASLAVASGSGSTERENVASPANTLAVASGSGSTERENVASPANTLAEDNLKVFSLPAESSLKTPSKPMDPASSIEQIEKIVKKNMKRTPKAAKPSKRAIQRRNLRSMR